MRPLIALCMIVKDEASRIRETLLTVRPYVDRFTILDTGSTDGTQEIVRKTMKGMEGDLYEKTFEAPFDYAEARNCVMDLEAEAKSPAVFILMMSGDEALAGGDELRRLLEAARDGAESIFNVTVKSDGFAWAYPRVTRTGSLWRYVGLRGIHEQPMLDGATHPSTGASLPGVVITHEASDPLRRFSSMFEHHLPMLEQEIFDKPDNKQALYYLGQTYGYLSEKVTEQTAISFRITSMGYWHRYRLLAETPDELRYSMCRFLDMASKTGIFSPDEMTTRWNSFCDANPDFAEAHLLRLDALGKTTPRSRAHEMVKAALDVVAIVRQNKQSSVSSLPTDDSGEWKAYVLAAMNANLIVQTDPEALASDGVRWTDKIEQFCRAGVEAGGSPMVFNTLRGNFGSSPMSLADISGPPDEQSLEPVAQA